MTTTGERSADQAGKGRPNGQQSGQPTTRLRGEPVGLIPKAYAAGKRNLHDWLDRPMTSLHLVLAIFLLLLAIGLLMVLSSSSVTSYRKDGSSFAVFQSQILFAAIGVPAFVIASRMPLRLIRGASTAALLISLALLVAVLLPHVGATLNGATSWIKLPGGISFQPSEVAKLSLLLWSANLLASRRSNLGSLRALLVPLMPVSALMALLIMLQPDFGTTVTLAIVLMAVLYFAGAPLWLFGVVGALGASAMAYLLISAPYRLARLTALLDPEAHPDSSYQLRQALYGMGNGGWFGVGLGQSRAKWSWLPNADSDFIFAIIGEELGLIGAILVLILFGLLAYTGMRIARRNVDPFVKIVAGSATVWLVCQAAINIGYVVGLLPTTGLTLPMISAGGTSLVVTMIVFGLLANFARREPQAAAALAARGPGTVLRFLGIGAVRADREIEPAKKVAKREARRVKQAAKQAERRTKAKAKAAATERTGKQKQQRPAAARTAAGPRRPAAAPDRQPARRAGGPATPPADRAGSGRPAPGTRGRPKTTEPTGHGRSRPTPADPGPRKADPGARKADSAARPAERTSSRKHSERVVDPRRRPQPGDSRRGGGGR